MRIPKDSVSEISASYGRNVFSWAPKATVVIPCHNAAGVIVETIESALAQKFKDREIIVVNDGSPDTQDLENIINLYLPEIVYVKQPHLGRGAARNTAIRHARGEIIAFLDAGDVWTPDFLASQIAFLGRGYDLAYCDANRFGSGSARRTTFMEISPSDGEATASALLERRCTVLTSGTVATKAALMHAGLFENERVPDVEFHLWLRMAKSGSKIGYQRKQLLKYRDDAPYRSGQTVQRTQDEISVLNRIRGTIELDAAQTNFLKNRIAGLEFELSLDRGREFLLKEDFAAAYQAFADANRQRRSTKLTAITWLARIAPQRLLKHYKNRPQNQKRLL